MNDWSPSKPVRNDPKLMEPTKIVSHGGFCISGKAVPVGQEVSLPQHVAADLVAQGKAEFVVMK